MKTTTALLLMTTLMGWIQPAPAHAGTLKVEKIVTAENVENRVPAGITSGFEAGTAKVFCWVQLSAVEPPAKLKFVWSFGGKVIGEYTADIKVVTKAWWAEKKVRPGSWKVELFGENGASLGSSDFTVGPVPEPKPKPEAKKKP